MHMLQEAVEVRVQQRLAHQGEVAVADSLCLGDGSGESKGEGGWALRGNARRGSPPTHQPTQGTPKPLGGRREV